MPGNIPRMIPKGLGADIRKYVLPVPPIMRLFMEHGVTEEEAFRVMNMGVGFTLTVPSAVSRDVVDYINATYSNRFSDVERKAAVIGRVVPRTSGKRLQFVDSLK